MLNLSRYGKYSSMGKFFDFGIHGMGDLANDYNHDYNPYCLFK